MAERTCEDGPALYPGDPELLFWRAMVLRRRGQLPEVAGDYQATLDATAKWFFFSRMRGHRL